MILRHYLGTLASTWMLAFTLPVCLPSLGYMLLWLFALSFYLVFVVARGLVELDHIERSMVPRQLPDESPGVEQ